MWFFCCLLQSNHLDASKTLLDELSQESTVVTQLFEDTTEEEKMLFVNVPSSRWCYEPRCLLYNIRDGVLRVEEHTWRTESMDDPIDVEMVKEVRGLTMCTECMVSY